ncbi:hypothetical protein SynMEDNS5_01794 [Synechococcus sp. MEDNS5]|nr:hypothetical protein SynMEDNS5_01794 [Synechococcus sp. MEDNS5]
MLQVPAPYVQDHSNNSAKSAIAAAGKKESAVNPVGSIQSAETLLWAD